MNHSATLDAPAPAAKSRRGKRLVRVCWAMFALVVGVSLFWTYSYYTALWERDALIAELRARGESVWWEEVAEKLLAEQSSHTGAELYLKALWETGGEFNRNKPWLPSATLDAIRKQYPEPTIRPEVEQELKLVRPAFELVEQAVRRPPGLLTTNLITDDPSSLSLPHIQTARNLHRMLSWEAYDAVARSDPRRAFAAVRLALQSSEQLAAEPFVICHGVRFALEGIAGDDLAMCLSYFAPTGAEFQTLDRLYSAHDDGVNIQQTLATERAMSLATFGSDEFLPIYLSNRGSGGTMSKFEWWAYRHWLRMLGSRAGLPATIKSQTEMMRLVERVRPLLDRPDVDPAVIETLADQAEDRSPVHRLTVNSKNFCTYFARNFQWRLVAFHRRLILARLSLRLRRHYDRHGRLPDSLDDLCDESMPRIRLEWFQNQPIVYKPKANGFRLELPESIVPPDAQYRLRETPILSDWGVEIEFKTLKQGPTK
jgi:hypothetical protein